MKLNSQNRISPIIDPDITHEEREEEMDFLREEFGIA